MTKWLAVISMGVQLPLLNVCSIRFVVLHCSTVDKHIGSASWHWCMATTLAGDKPSFLTPLPHLLQEAKRLRQKKFPKMFSA